MIIEQEVMLLGGKVYPKKDSDGKETGELGVSLDLLMGYKRGDLGKTTIARGVYLSKDFYGSIDLIQKAQLFDKFLVEIEQLETKNGLVYSLLSIDEISK